VSEALPTSLRLLAAEDNPLSQLLLRTLLAGMGVEPHIVADGEAAVEAWASGGFDLILMDVQMPRLDGVGATRRIREREIAEGRARTPIIALTANATEAHAAVYRAAGMDAVVAKPVDLAALVGEMNTQLRRAREGGGEDKRALRG
jgi:two-component system, sensor histidine kinase